MLCNKHVVCNSICCINNTTNWEKAYWEKEREGRESRRESLEEREREKGREYIIYMPVAAYKRLHGYTRAPGNVRDFTSFNRQTAVYLYY